MDKTNKEHQKAFSLRMTHQLHSLMLANYKSWGYSSVNELIVFAINQLIESHLMRLSNNLVLNSSSPENAIELILDIKEDQNRIFDVLNELSQKSTKDLKVIKSIVGFNSMTNVSYLDMKGGSTYLEKARTLTKNMIHDNENETISEQIDKVIHALG